MNYEAGQGDVIVEVLKGTPLFHPITGAYYRAKQITGNRVVLFYEVEFINNHWGGFPTGDVPLCEHPLKDVSVLFKVEDLEK